MSPMLPWVRVEADAGVSACAVLLRAIPTFTSREAHSPQKTREKLPGMDQVLWIAKAVLFLCDPENCPVYD